MRDLRPQLAILLGAFALAVVISLVASTPAFYRKLSLAAHAMPDTVAAGAVVQSPDLVVFNLRDPSFSPNSTVWRGLWLKWPCSRLP